MTDDMRLPRILQRCSRTEIAAALVAVTLAIGACGGGDSLSDDLQAAADQIAGDSALAQDDAECIADEVADKIGEDDALSILGSDSDFSELNGYEHGSVVASAYSSCTDRSFSADFGYTP